MLITKEAEVNLSSKVISYYENKGYYIPRYKGDNGRLSVKEGTKIIVKVNDLPNNSRASIKYVCDYCLEEGINNIVTTSWKSYYNHKNNIINRDACSNHSTKKSMELHKTSSVKDGVLSKEDIAKHYLDLYNKIGEIPKTKHIQKESKENKNFPNLRTISNAFGSVNKLKEYCGLSTKTHTYDKGLLIELLTNYIINNGIPKNKRGVFKKRNGLPSYETYVSHFGDDLVNLVQLCGFALSDEEKYNLNNRGRKNILTKEEIIIAIYKMQADLKRPLIYDDFRNPSKDTIGISEIRKYFGTVNKMKALLGLEITQENMIDKQLDITTAIQHIDRLCKEIFTKEKRKIITYKDIDRCEYTNNPWNYHKILFKELGMTLRGYLNSIGFDLVQEGNGLNYTFEDGEKTRSQYELDFSIYLRDHLNLKYNDDYLRDIRYKTFIIGYNGLQDCDYVINYKGKTIYIEIAGMLRDYQNWYYQNKPLNSKSKEKYRLKLKEKENMFKESELEYYILFPCDLNEEKYNEIFS